MQSFITHFLPIYTLWQREIIRFLRQRHRVFGALGQPFLFWLLVGGSFSSSFRPSLSLTHEMNYFEYIFPGILVMVVLFTAIFSSFSTIEDRKEGFLQAVLVSPAPRISIILGKITGGATLAVLQALLFLSLAPFIHISLNMGIFLKVMGILFLIALSLTAFGFCFAWKMESVQGFHAIMMLILIPMWFLSGALFPLHGVPWIIEWIMKINPLTYSLAGIRHVLYEGSLKVAIGFPSLEVSLSVTLLFGLLSIYWALRSLKRL